ncbi:hypothetical protein B566_EDAN006135 [Ephemera danica]|nr:hypothetical protein B566_EDAN006135 [Ephemera danica]
MLRSLVLFGIIATFSNAYLAKDNILCSTLNSVPIAAEQLEGQWIGLEMYRGMANVSEVLEVSCTLIDDITPSPERAEALTLVYTNGTIHFNTTTVLIADGDKWKIQRNNNSLYILSLNQEQYLSEVVCNNPTDPAEAKAQYALTYRRVGVNLSEETITKVREDVKSALGLQDLGLIMPFATYCEP